MDTGYSVLQHLIANSTDDCLLWPFSLNSKGYGQVWIDGKMRRASRVACAIARGTPPTARHEAAHSCRDRSCINPRHLSWKTHAENLADRLRDNTNPAGERNGNAKLNNEEAQAIRERYAAGGITQQRLADEYGVSHMAINHIVRNKSYGLTNACPVT